MKPILKLGAIALLLLCVRAGAAEIQYDFFDATLNGTPVTGTITIDDQTNAVVAWQIQTQPGPSDDGNANFSGQVYSDATGNSDLGGLAEINLRENEPNPFTSGSNPFIDFRIQPAAAGILAFGAAGGQVTIQECWNCSPSRTGTATVVPRETGGAIEVGFADPSISVNEGDGSVTLTVEFLPDSPDIGQVLVDVATVDDSATAGADYDAVSTTLAFGPNDTSATVTIPVTADTAVEDAESFLVGLSNLRGTDSDGLALDPTRLRLTNATAVVAIQDDDLVITTIDSVSACVGSSGFQIDALVTGFSDSGNLIFVFSADGPALQGDVERFGVNFDNDGNILFGGPEVLTVGTAPFDRWLDGSVSDATVTSLGGSQFRVRATLPLGSEPFAIGDQAAGLTWRTTQRTVTSGPVAVEACAAQAAPGTIEFQTPSATLNEADTVTSLELTLTRTGGTDGEVSVTLASVDGTATAGEDYVATAPQLVTWADGDSEPKTVQLPDQLIDDAAVEGDETYSLVLSDPTGGAALGTSSEFTVTIQDDDVAGPSAGGDEQVELPEGDTVELTFDVDGSFPISLSAELGTLSPTTLSAPGTVTYSFDPFALPDPPAVGDTVGDAIILIDADGGETIKQVAISVVTAQSERDLTTIANLTPNQRALARLVDDVCPRLDAQSTDADVADLASICSRLRDVETSDTQVRDALDAINPEELVVMATSAVRLSLLQHGNLEQRINGLRSGASGIDLAGIDLEIQGQQISGDVVAEVLRGLLGAGASADDPFERWGLFADGKLKWGDRDDTENEAAFDFDVAFVTLGADYRFRPNLIAGGAVSWGAIQADFEDGTDFSVDSWSGSLFGTWYSESGAYLDALATYGQNDYDSERRIRYTDAAGAIDRIANGETEGEQFSAGLSGGWDWNRGAFTAGPHVGLYYLDLTVDGFTEDGAGGLDLAIGEQEATSFTMNAGLHASYVVNLPFGVLIPHVRADSVFEFEDEQQQIEIGFASDPFRNDPTNPSPAVTLSTDRPDDQYYVLSAGASAQFVRGVSAYVNYQYTASMENWAISNLTYGLRFERSF